MPATLEFEFRNPQQREVFYSIARNLLFSGGFNNGKTYIGCLKILLLLLRFYNSRALIARQVFSDLKKTTMETFFSICPAGIIESHNSQDGVTLFKNGSMIFWMHLDNVDENTLRGLEINFALVDQGEETQEKVFDILNARIGRWNHAIVPPDLLDANPNWPKNATGKYIIPSYFLVLCNPDTEFHYLYRKFHPDSIERITEYVYIEGEWDKNLGSEETYEAVTRGKDQEWINKYVKGQWGSSSAAIHHLDKQSVVDYNDKVREVIERGIAKARLYRSLDHGQTSPTCCLWFMALDGVYICYREYYVPNKVISYHRQAISDLSVGEYYSGDYADPQIFKKESQKNGGFWSVAEEYIDSDIEGPELVWMPADNNEFATRNRLNELLKPSNRFTNPFTGESPAPGLYFIKRSEQYASGAFEAIRQLGGQRKKILDVIDGKTYYSDDRDESITDHAYDPIRYFVAMHSVQPSKEPRKISRNSFAYYEALRMREAMRGPVAASVN